MKKILLISVFFLLLLGCEDDVINTLEYDMPNSSQTKAAMDLIITAGEWENWTEIEMIGTTNAVTPPWNTMTSTSIPYNIRTDVKREDGWELLINTFTKKERFSNYLIFHNRFTGFLKGFYYLEEAANGNNGYWIIGFEGGNQKLLYNQDGYFTYPLSSSKEVASVNVMNITSNTTKGFTKGWNCFEVELTYDPNKLDLWLTIDSYQNNISTIEISGTYESTSSGTIISATPASSKPGPKEFLNSNIKAVGEDAKNWIYSATSTKDPSKTSVSLGASVLDALKKNAMNQLLNTGFGSIFASSFLSSGTGSTPTNLQLQFTTTGKVDLKGQSTTPTTTTILPLKVKIDKETILGAWNLPSVQSVGIPKSAELTGSYENLSLNRRVFEYEIPYSFLSFSAPPLISPELSPYIIEKDSHGFPYLFEGSIANFNETNDFRISLSKNEIFKERFSVPYSQKELVLAEGDNKFKLYRPISVFPFMVVRNYVTVYPDVEVGGQGVNIPGLDLVTKDGNNSPYSFELPIIKYQISYKISVNGKIKTFYSTRTYDPEYQYYDYRQGSRPYTWTLAAIDKYLKK